MKTYTIVIKCNDARGPFVFLKRFENDAAVIAYAVGELVDPVNNVQFILVREGDAHATDPIIWDSRKHYKPEVKQVYQMQVFLVQEETRQMMIDITKHMTPQEFARFKLENGYV